MLISLALAAIASPTFDQVEIFLRRQGFERAPEDYGLSLRRSGFVHGATGSRLTIHRSPRLGASSLSAWRESSKKGYARLPRNWEATLHFPSRLPPWGAVQFNIGNSDVIHFFSHIETGSIRLSNGVEWFHEKRIGRGIPDSVAIPMLEALTRLVIADGVGRTFSAASVDSASGLMYGFRDATNNLYLDAVQWAERAGFPYRLSAHNTVIEIETSDGDLLLAMGADKVKLEDEWQDLKLPVAAMYARILLPPEARSLVR